MAPKRPSSAPIATSPTPGAMLRRGLRKRCARCGQGGLCHGTFHLIERCPRCGVKFERRDGFFQIAYIIDFALTEGFLAIAVMAFVNELGGPASEPHFFTELTVAAFAMGLAVAAPILFWPTARTLWFAVDLSSNPLRPSEVAAADAAVLRAFEP